MKVEQSATFFISFRPTIQGNSAKMLTFIVKRGLKVLQFPQQLYCFHFVALSFLWPTLRKLEKKTSFFTLQKILCRIVVDTKVDLDEHEIKRQLFCLKPKTIFFCHYYARLDVRAVTSKRQNQQQMRFFAFSRCLLTFSQL